MKILIVEDEPGPREGLRRLLANGSVDWAVLEPRMDGVSGLNAVKEQEPDLIITDIRMPDIDGLEMIASIRRIGARASIIVLSGYPDFEYARRCLSLGVSHYLLKPATAETILDAVRSVEDGRWADGELSDWVEGRKDLRGPGVIFLFRSSMPLSVLQKKTLRHDLARQTGNPHGSMVAEVPAAKEYFFFFRGLHEFPRAGSDRLMEALRLKLHCRVIGGALLVSDADGAFGPEILRTLLRYPLLENSPDFLWGYPEEIPPPVSYQLSLERELVNGLQSRNPALIVSALDRFRHEYFRRGFDPASVLMASRRFFFFTQNFLKDIDTARFSAFQSMDPVSRLGNALDAAEVGGIFQEISDLLCATGREAGREGTDNMKVLSSLRLVEEQLCDPPTLAECAEDLGLSSEYFSRLFKAEMGQGFSKYVMRKRIELAKTMLADHGKTIHQVSASLGFHNSKYFCSVFRKETSFTPSEFRARFR